MTTSLHDYASRGKLEKIIEKVGKGRNLNRQEPGRSLWRLVLYGVGFFSHPPLLSRQPTATRRWARPPPAAISMWCSGASSKRPSSTRRKSELFFSLPSFGPRSSHRPFSSHGWTALHLAALKGHVDIAKALVAAGIDAKLKDKEGHTAKELAASPPDWVPAEQEAVDGRAAIAAML